MPKATLAWFCLAIAPLASFASTLPPLDQVGLRRAVEKMAKELQVPGAVVILRAPAGKFTFAYGTRALGGQEGVTLSDHIRIGSITKSWTGTVILQQVQEGKLGLTDAVSKFRPDVPDGERIKIEQLLDMRSGLFNYSETPQLNETLDREPQKAWTSAELLALAWENPPYFVPGAGFHYSNTNTILLGLIAEKIDGKPLATIFQDRLFKPLGMSDSVFPDIHSNAIPGPHPRGYMFGDNMLTLHTPAVPQEMQAAAKAGTLKPNDETDANPSWGWAAGAGISTAKDLVTWVEALVSGHLLNAELQKKRLMSVQPIKADDPSGALYGLGIAKFGMLYGHTGELPGFNTFAGHDPINKVTLVVWTNLAPTADGRDPATTIARALVGQVYGLASP